MAKITKDVKRLTKIARQVIGSTHANIEVDKMKGIRLYPGKPTSDNLLEGGPKTKKVKFV